MTDPLQATDLVMGLLADGNVAAVVRLTRGRQLDEGSVRRALDEYPHRPSWPPGRDWRSRADVVVVTAAERPTWSVSVPFWTEVEGWSDLAASLTISSDASGGVDVELDDVHVP